VGRWASERSGRDAAARGLTGVSAADASGEIGQAIGGGGRCLSVCFGTRSRHQKTKAHAAKTSRATENRTPYATALGMTIFHYPTRPILVATDGAT